MSLSLPTVVSARKSMEIVTLYTKIVFHDRRFRDYARIRSPFFWGLGRQHRQRRYLIRVNIRNRHCGMSLSRLASLDTQPKTAVNNPKAGSYTLGSSQGRMSTLPSGFNFYLVLMDIMISVISESTLAPFIFSAFSTSTDSRYIIDTTSIIFASKRLSTLRFDKETLSSLKQIRGTSSCRFLLYKNLPTEAV